MQEQSFLMNKEKTEAKKKRIKSCQAVKILLLHSFIELHRKEKVGIAEKHREYTRRTNEHSHLYTYGTLQHKKLKLKRKKKSQTNLFIIK